MDRRSFGEIQYLEIQLRILVVTDGWIDSVSLSKLPLSLKVGGVTKEPITVRLDKIRYGGMREFRSVQREKIARRGY